MTSTSRKFTTEERLSILQEGKREGQAGSLEQKTLTSLFLASCIMSEKLVQIWS